ncbi:MAG: DUF4194 domain-containing protein [Gluconacetobacter diazotrophicus]|nr:DUF4194 domain-containing protein [Gluconacetobacter diazotrophicus]
MAELREVAAILDGGGIEEGELHVAMQAALLHQCLYEDWPHPPAFRLLSRHIAQVRPIFAAFGYRLVHHPAARMIVLETGAATFGLPATRLRKDETLVLLALRLLYAEGIAALDESGRVEATTDDLHDRLRAGNEEPPPMPRLLEILRGFARKGLLRLGDAIAAERVVPLTIMPGITVLVPDTYVDAVIDWLESAEADRREGSLLAHVAERRAGLGSSPAAEADTTVPPPDGSHDVPA